MRSFRFYLIRIGICVFVLFGYIYAWRPVRRVVTQKVIYPKIVKNRDAPFKTKLDGVALRITFLWMDHYKTVQYRPQAGFFFLISLMTLILAAGEQRWFFILVGLHIFSTLLTGGMMLLSRNGWYPGFILVDLIGSYLVPVLSMALAVWVTAHRSYR